MFEPEVAQALVRDGRHIAITGAGGWIGLATLDLLEQGLGDDIANRVSCFGASRRELVLRSGRRMVQSPLSDLSALDAENIWLLHFAFQTKERAEALGEDAYRASNLAISETVLKALESQRVEAVFVASSGAASKVDDPRASAAMRLYGQMKLDDEERFAAWAQKHGRRAVIGRIFNITGPYINKHEAYAIASFILDGLAQRPIAVHAPRQVFRAYVAIRELMSLIFALLGDAAEDVVRFDTGGQALELGEVARVVASTLGGGHFARAAITDPISDSYFGDGEAYAALLERYRIEPVALDQQITETAQYLRSIAA